jgi:hypothetical protein
LCAAVFIRSTPLLWVTGSQPRAEGLYSVSASLSAQINHSLYSFSPCALSGLWTCHQYTGDIAAAVFSAYVLRSGFDWRWCIAVPAVINGIWAVINLMSVPNRPEEAG